MSSVCCMLSNNILFYEYCVAQVVDIPLLILSNNIPYCLLYFTQWPCFHVCFILPGNIS